MKKILIIMFALLCATHVSADKTESGQGKGNNTTTENTQKTPTQPVPTSDPLPTTTDLKVGVTTINLTPTTGGPQPTPNPPTTTIIREVENSVQPDLLKELEDVRAERKLLREQKQALLDEVKNLQSDKADLKDDLELVSKEIQNLLEERSQNRTTIRALHDVIDEGPGSLFKGWVYSPELEWVYVSPTIVPYSYSQKDGWMIYQYGTDPRRVYYFNTKTWELLDEKQEQPKQQTKPMEK
jgi:hypothetical protein